MIIHAGELSIQCLVLGDLMTNCYVPVSGGTGFQPVRAAGANVVSDALNDTGYKPVPQTEVCWVVDPGLSAGPLLEYLERTGLSPERILLTHGHADHIAGVAAVKEAFPDAVLTVPHDDVHMLTDPAANLSLPFGFNITTPAPDQTVRAGEELKMGPLTWRVIDTSGHTPGGVSYYCAEAEVVITGDALFAESIGRTDIPGASEARQLKNIRENLLTLPDATRVLPGHGPITTIEHERRHNPFLSTGFHK